MTNSDSGTKLNPGDRVRIKLNPKHDSSYSAEQNRARQALAGQEGSIRERVRLGTYRVAPPGSVERGAWFEADEIEPIVTDPDGHEVGAPASPLDVLDAAVQQALAAARREAQGWHSAALLARGEAEEARQEAKDARAARLAGEAERDALRAACEAVVGPAGGVSAGALAASVRAAWSILKAEQAARYDALACERAAHEETGRIADRRRKERDAAVSRALAAEAKLAAVTEAWGTLRAFLLALPRPLGAAGIEGVDAVDKALGGVASDLPCELTVNFSEWRGTAYAVPTSDREPRRWRLTFPMTTPLAAAEQRNLVAPGRIKYDAGIGGWRGRVMVVQRAPVAGAAIELEVVEWIEPKEAKPEREDTWEATLEQRVAEIEARLGRLEEPRASLRQA